MQTDSGPPPLPSEKIDLNDHAGVEYWARRFNVSPDVVRAAVAAFGTSARDIADKIRQSE